MPDYSKYAIGDREYVSTEPLPPNPLFDDPSELARLTEIGVQQLLDRPEAPDA